MNLTFRWTFSQLVMQREDHAVRHPLDMIIHVQPWMLIPIIPLVAFFEGLNVLAEIKREKNNLRPRPDLRQCNSNQRRISTALHTRTHPFRRAARPEYGVIR